MATSEKSPLLISAPAMGHAKYVLVIHGGAGTITRESSTPEQQANYRSALKESLEAVSPSRRNYLNIPIFPSFRGIKFSAMAVRL